jgi:hypothetical protein
MRKSIEALFTHVVVRRTGVGAAPFTWEVRGESPTPIHVSADRYRTMDAAYEAGQARLPEFIPSRKSRWRDSDDFDEPVLNLGTVAFVFM